MAQINKHQLSALIEGGQAALCSGVVAIAVTQYKASDGTIWDYQEEANRRQTF